MAVDAIELRPGTTGMRLKETLNAIADHAGLVESNAAGRTALEMLEEYIKWAEQAAVALNAVLPVAHVDELIHTGNYWALRHADQHTPRVIAWVLQEVRRQIEGLRALAGAVNAEIARWTGDETVITVPDTNVFHDHGGEILGLDWATITGSSTGVRLVVPVAVMRELDRQKRSGRAELRLSASKASRDLNRNLLPDPTARKPLHHDGQQPLTLEAYVHGELRDKADVDGELIAACSWISAVSGRGDLVRLVTHDGNMVVRARAEGVESVFVSNMPAIAGE